MKNYYNRLNYVRRNSYQNKREKEKYIKKMLKQTVVCISILIITIIIKKIDTSFTSQINDNINKALSYNVDFKSVYKEVETFARSTGVFNFVNSQKGKLGEEKVLYIHDVDKGDNSEEEFRSGFPQDMEEGEIVIDRDVVLPVEGEISSEFGMRNHPVYNKEMFHYGIDIEAEEGTLIVSAIEGVIEKVDYNEGYGNYVIISHGEGIFTLYAHCKEIIVEEGQEVAVKETIAEVGSTGNTSGSHLHFEIWKYKKALNPLNYINID